jgi:hypothetical protein
MRVGPFGIGDVHYDHLESGLFIPSAHPTAKLSLHFHILRQLVNL